MLQQIQHHGQQPTLEFWSSGLCASLCYLIETKCKRKADGGGWAVREHCFLRPIHKVLQSTNVPFRHFVQNKMNMLDFLHKVAGFCLEYSLVVSEFHYPPSRRPPTHVPTFLWLNSLPSTLDLREH